MDDDNLSPIDEQVESKESLANPLVIANIFLKFQGNIKFIAQSKKITFLL